MGFLGVPVVTRYRSESFGGQSFDSIFVRVLLLGAGVGFNAFRDLTFALVDAVRSYGAGSEGGLLLVEQAGEKHRVVWTPVINIHATTPITPPRVNGMQRARFRCGGDASVMPTSPRGFPGVFKPDAAASELIKGVDAARQVTP
ncbi:MAG: hypothetical protein M3Y93_09160 [Pseudomonadota bacterium]|nr:hypothetical protein [Pseudomonadota bacterium]